MYIGNIKDYISYSKINKSSMFKDGNMEVMVLNLPAGAEMKPHTSSHDAFAFVQEGTVDFILEGELFPLKKGDLIHFKAGQLHSLKATSDFSMLIVK